MLCIIKYEIIFFVNIKLREYNNGENKGIIRLKSLYGISPLLIIRNYLFSI